MISLSNVEELKGSTLLIKRTGTKREPFTVTGELIMISGKRIVLAGTKSGRTRRIPMDRVVSVTEVEPEFKILYFSQDGSETASSLKKEVIE